MTWASLIGPPRERRFERPEVEAVGLQRHRHQLDPEPLQHQQRAVIGRLLDDDPVAGLEQMLEQHPARLQRPVGDHHLPGVEPAMPLGDPLAEPRMPDPGPVGERLFPILGQRDGSSIPHSVPGQDVRARAPREQTKSCPEPSRPSLATPPLCGRAAQSDGPKGAHPGVSELKGAYDPESSDTPCSVAGAGARPARCAAAWGCCASSVARARLWRRAIKTRVEAERLQALHREVFAVGHARVSRQGRRLAAVLACGDGALLSHRSAAALWGLSRPWAGAMDVTAPVGRQGIHRRDGIWIHRGRLHRRGQSESRWNSSHRRGPHPVRPRRSRRRQAT